MRTIVLAILLLAANIAAHASIVKGKIKDVLSGEEIIGASVIIKGSGNKGTATGLDGSASSCHSTNSHAHWGAATLATRPRRLP